MNKPRRPIRSLLIALVAAVAAYAILFMIPLNYYIESPGSADNVAQFVSMPGHKDRAKGSYMITSVSLLKATPATYMAAKVMPNTSIEPADDMTGGEDNATFTKVQDFYMQSAINESIAVAYQAAGQQFTKTYEGIYVLQVADNSKFAGKLAVGDTITKVDQHHFDSAAGYQQYLASKSKNDRVTITYLHNHKVKTATAGLIKLATGKSGIGVGLTDNVKVTTKIPVKIDPGEIGGPSGGLMFTLQVYQQLTQTDLRHGKDIAGTGTIDADGNVGEIGGIDKKIIAAHNAGAKIFFAPYVKPTKAVLKDEENGKTNYQTAVATAKKYAPEMKVVPVRTFADAQKYLESH